MSPAATAPTLASQLDEQRSKFFSAIPAETLNKVQSTSKDLASKFTPSPLPVGQKAPSFSLPNLEDKQVTLESLLSSHSSVIVTWYRGGWCPYCVLALRSMMNMRPEFEKAGAKMVFITGESRDEGAQTVSKLGLDGIEILGDDGLKVAEEYGVMFEMADELLELYGGFGVNMLEMNGNKGKDRTPRLPVPSTFVIGKDGKVVWHYADLDYTKRAEPSDVLKAVKSVA